LLDRIIEIACCITDGNLDHKIRGPNLVIHQSDDLLNSMDAWCIEHHGESGLTDLVRKSTLTTEQAELQVMDFVRLHIPDAKVGILSGNSIHVDRQFLCKEMPSLIDHLHYRIVDVSTVKELAKRWAPELFFKKKETHRALEDIEESIEELRYYKGTIFNK
jgi:oligoribonuclease